MQIALVAGETSGDIHGGNLVRELKRLEPGATVWAVGGPRLAEAGAEIVFPCSRIAAMGLLEAVEKLPELASARKEVVTRLKLKKPDVFVPIDFGGLNLRLAAKARSLGIPVVYFIPPKAWAWGGHRVAKVRERVNRVLTILPFENDFWRGEGVRSDYVGSPVLDHLKSVSFAREKGTIGLLPGSRVGEVARIWPALAGAARILARGGGRRFLVAAAEGLPPGMPDEALLAGLEYEMKPGGAQEVMERSELVLVASGTATLECALLGAPMVVVYNMSPITFAIAKMAVKTTMVSLPNLIAGRMIVPELFQAGGFEVAEAAARLLETEGALDEMIAELAKVRMMIGEPGASERAARLILETARGEASA